MLQAAVDLELATIPPYLCALYSIHPVGNQEAKLVIRSVVVEEMLHMVLAANVMNAIGGEPHVGGSDHTPRYPHQLPDGVVMDLLPFCEQAVETFLKVENPEYLLHPAGAEHPLLAGRRHQHHVASCATVGAQPQTIGAFYALIEDGLKAAAAELGEASLFCGDPARQVTREYYYAGGGASVVVSDLESALAALGEIVDQGEGEVRSMLDDDGDLAHYFRFNQLKYGRAYLSSDAPDTPTGPAVEVDYDTVYPMLANPRREEYTDPELREAADAANRTWSELLVQIDSAFNGDPASLVPAVHSMFRLRDQALVLLNNPLPGHPGRHAGPTFEWHPPEVAGAGPQQIADRRFA
jgi:hypothetical protein